MCVPEEHELELMYHINLVLLGNQTVSVPTRNFVSSSSGRNQCFFPGVGEVNNIV